MMIYKTDDSTIWLRKSWDLKHGFGWFCQILGKKYKNIGFGFSKNKFTSFRTALKNAESD